MSKVDGPTITTRSKVPARRLSCEPSPLARSRLKTTSSTVRGLPSWKRTPWRSSNRQVVGSTSFHETASAGSRRKFGSRRVRPS